MNTDDFRSIKPVSIWSALFRTFMLVGFFCGASCTPFYEEDQELHKLVLGEVRSILGPPDDTASFSLYKGRGLYEYQSGLDALVAGLSERDTLTITELTWHLPNDATQKVWLCRDTRGVYRVVDNLRWGKDVKF